MLPMLIHSLLLFAMPFAISFVFGYFFGRQNNPWLLHLALFLTTALCVLIAQYATFVMFSNRMTGNALAGLPTFDEVLGGLLWFCIPAMFTTMPIVATGYLVGIVSRKRPAN